MNHKDFRSLRNRKSAIRLCPEAVIGKLPLWDSTTWPPKKDLYNYNNR